MADLKKMIRKRIKEGIYENSRMDYYFTDFDLHIDVL